jgi:cell division protein FtsB
MRKRSQPSPPLRLAGAEEIAGLEAERDKLTAEVEELRRTVEDLRAFERAYRSRLLAYVEGQARELRQEDGR